MRLTLTFVSSLLIVVAAAAEVLSAGVAAAAEVLNVRGSCVAISSTQSSAALLLVANGRAVHSCARGAAVCEVTLPAGRRELAAYELTAGGALALIAAFPAEIRGPACASGVHESSVHSTAGPSTGILYEAWHAPPVTAIANISARGGTVLTVEDVLRSRGNLQLADVYGKYPGTDTIAASFYYQSEPQAGFYCIYRARPGEAGVVPDCPGISATLARHAAELSGSGIDFVTADGTNLPLFSPFADLIQLRPAEVLFEEWAALRARGITTPAIAAWQTVKTGGDLYQRMLDLYNNATFAPLVHRDAATKKFIFFVPPGGDTDIIAAIENNGGRNNVLVQQMWALNSLESKGQWSFFAPCTDGGRYTTSVVGKGRGALGCAQRASNASGPLARVAGSQIAVSPSYQLGYGSIPFEGANKYEGLTFKRQFATVLDSATHSWAAGRSAAASSSSSPSFPAHLYLSSYNEWTAQPQHNPFGKQFTHSLGLSGDPQGGELFVDSYGQSVSRDIEASTDGGTGIFDIMASCLRVIQLAAALDEATFSVTDGAPLTPATASLWPGASRAPALAALRAAFGAGPSGLAACNVAGELCCKYDDATDGYAPIWALRLLPAVDALVTADANEVAALIADGWVETCNAYDGPTDFCVERSVADSSAAWHGPFALHSGGCTAAARRAPLHRCYDAGLKHHFVSLDPKCEGATVESLLGCVALDPTSNMARPLRTCSAPPPAGLRYHALDGPCETGDHDGGVLGFVR